MANCVYYKIERMHIERPIWQIINIRWVSHAFILRNRYSPNPGFPNITGSFTHRNPDARDDVRYLVVGHNDLNYSPFLKALGFELCK